MPRIGDKVKPGRSEMVYEISYVSPEGDEVNLQVPGTNLERFRVRTDTLTFVERKPQPKTSNPFTTPEPEIDTAEMMERIASIHQESLKQLDDSIDILKAYLKTQGAPRAAISTLEGLTVEQHASWKKAVKKIEELLDE